MPENPLEIAIAPERLEEGSPEERAGYGLFTIRMNDSFLTEGVDFFVNNYRTGPLVSGYHAAEWFAWNWWRLRWEPRSGAPDWWRAHRMTAIGEGYVWPNITIASDGSRTALLSDRSSCPDTKPFRYLGALPCIVPSETFESAVDAFIARIQGRLRNEEIEETNLDRIWKDVLCERRDERLSQRRKLEALLGTDPDEADETTLNQLLADAKLLGLRGAEELAADRPHSGRVMTVAELRQIAGSHGCSASSRDRFTFPEQYLSQPTVGMPAWQLGTQTAQRVRISANLGDGPISDKRLFELAGVTAPSRSFHKKGFSFQIEGDESTSRLVFRSDWQTNRRFDLARLLGDRLMNRQENTLFPATHAYTFRQKAQRTFAAELLAPFHIVEEMLGGDFSEDNQRKAADHFQVSEMAIRTLLVNHQRLDREDLDGFDNIAA